MKREYLIIILLLLLSGCEKDATIQTKEYPLVLTKEISEINKTGATFAGKILQNGSVDITDFGFTWTDGQSVFKTSLINNGIPEEFKYRISSDLKVGSTYSVQAYLQTKKNLVLGNKVQFKSLGNNGPVITDFYPKTGVDGSMVTIVGKYFSRISSNNKVFVNNIEGQIIYSSNDSIKFKTPQMAFFGNTKISVKVDTKTGISDLLFNIIGPTINSISSITGLSGNYLTLTGRNFTKNDTVIKVSFGTYPAQVINSSDSQVKVVVPAATYSLLSETSVVLKLENGLKTTTYKDRFLIGKSWESKQATPFDWSWRYSAFTYNEKGYILELNTKQFYEYNSLANQWNLFPSSIFPGERNEGSLYIVEGDKLFKLGGHNYLDSALGEFWEFSFNDKSWNRKTDLPFKIRDAVYLNLKNQLYIVTDEGQVWKCDLINETYIRLNDSPFKFVWSFASAFEINGKMLVAIYGQNWQYNDQNDTWSNISANPIQKQSYTENAFGFSYNGTGYVLQGGENLYKYDILNGIWIKVSEFPGSRGDNSYKTAFTVGSRAYIAATSSNYVGCAPLMFSYHE
jgi:hypothetical protein